MHATRRFLLILFIAAFTISASPALGQDDLIAIDVLLQPDLKMLAEASNWNAKMREQSPDGFELDEEHAPHITLIQRFLAKSDLPKVLAAVDEVSSKLDVDSILMTATGFYHIPSDKIGLAGIVIEPSERLLALQQAIIDAVNVYERTNCGGFRGCTEIWP